MFQYCCTIKCSIVILNLVLYQTWLIKNIKPIITGNIEFLENYQPQTILSCLLKLSTSILNRRLTTLVFYETINSLMKGKCKKCLQNQWKLADNVTKTETNDQTPNAKLSELPRLRGVSNCIQYIPEKIDFTISVNHFYKLCGLACLRN